MITLLKNLECFCPEYSGIRDILIAGNKIGRICAPGQISETGIIDDSIECSGLYAFPGIVDQHVHIIGGGGEEGFESHIPEIGFDEIIDAGVTTVIGLLGADGCTKSLETLYSKAKALGAQGITTYIYTGSYQVPPPTFTESITRDLLFIDKVIGVGEIAVSDHRSSHAETSELVRICSDAYLAGLLSGKAGIVHFHMGDGKQGLAPLSELISVSDIPIGQLVPTHVNRSQQLFMQALEHCRRGGHIDLTSGEQKGLAVPEAVRMILQAEVDTELVTISSDGSASTPGGLPAKIGSLFEDVIKCAKDQTIGPEMIFSMVTKNVAKLLKLYPEKGVLNEGSDADIIITDKNYTLIKLFSMGKLLKGN